MVFVGGLDYNDRIDGASTPGGHVVSPSADDDMRYVWTDDALPVTPAFLKNQLKYEKPRAQVVCTNLCLDHCSVVLLYIERASLGMH